MSSNDETHHVENASRSAYDGRAEVRFAAIEARVAAVEVDVAVIRTSFATKEDVHSLRMEIQASAERIMAALHEQRLEFTTALAKQREDFQSALSMQQVELHKTLMSHTWKIYGLASLLMGGVYFIARYVH